MRRALLALALVGCGGQPMQSTGSDASAPAVDAGQPDAMAMMPPAEDSGADSGVAMPYPDPDWPTATPESENLDKKLLTEADSVAAANKSYCLLVIRHGNLVWESYFNGHDAQSTDHSWSIAKSYTSAVTGIAIDKGDIGSLSDSASKYVTQWKNKPNAAITIRDLVSMTSGLHWDVFGDYVTMAELAPDKTGYALGLGMDDTPGKTWTYNNSAVQSLEAVIRNATGKPLDVYAKDNLWSKIGQASAHWDKDFVGHPTAYANVLATCRDHARLGYLYLRGGKWKNEQVVSQAWVKATTTPSNAQNQAYGYLWWLNGHTPAMDAMKEAWPGQMVAGAPQDLFAARGFGNQFIDVIPSLDMIVVRFGADPVNAFDLNAMMEDSKFGIHDAILAPILAATK